MKIVLASDHAALDLRAYLVEKLVMAGHDTTEVGALSTDAYDYPDAADELAKALPNHDFGIVICGTGIGISIRANRYPQIRAALCTTEYMAEMAREHNDANVLALGARVVGTEQAWAITKAFLVGKSSEVPRHIARVEKLGRPI
jgi:ribose 5-phosphate isomerase B